MKNKSLTKQKLIEAVGYVIKVDGFDAVNISKVARQANVDRKLVYRYFGNLDGLVEAYVVQNDYWMSCAEHFRELLRQKHFGSSEDLIINVLQEQFRFFSREKEMQDLILLELSGSNELLRSIHRARESLGEFLLGLSDEHFITGKVNIRAITALLVGGIYYIILHTRFNGERFSGLDLADEEDHAALLEAIAQIISWSYREEKAS